MSFGLCTPTRIFLYPCHPEWMARTLERWWAEICGLIASCNKIFDVGASSYSILKLELKLTVLECYRPFG